MKSKIPCGDHIMNVKGYVRPVSQCEYNIIVVSTMTFIISERHRNRDSLVLSLVR